LFISDLLHPVALKISNTPILFSMLIRMKAGCQVGFNDIDSPETAIYNWEKEKPP
jgi:hypothetical protein